MFLTDRQPLLSSFACGSPWLLAFLIVLTTHDFALGQQGSPPATPNRLRVSFEKPIQGSAAAQPNNNGQAAPTTQSQRGMTPIRSSTGQSRPGGHVRVSKTLDQLPNTAGQIWREYDISPYTNKIKNVEHPEQAVLDWVLRETGTEMWFHEPLGLLHVSQDKLFVYHTPEIQTVVQKIVDRFVWTRGQLQEMDIQLVSVENPNWRSQSYSMLQPIDVKSPGVEAWMISKENASILLAQLRKRVDFKQHGGGRVRLPDGQKFQLEKTEPVQFVRSLRWVPNQFPNYQPLMTSLQEGYRLSISSLSSIDSESIEAIIQCEVDQVENLNNVKVGLPGVAGTADQMNLQIPQVVSWRLKERFRWPNDQVLLLSCGVVASPEPRQQRPRLGLANLGLSATRAKRADALLFLDYRGPASEAAVPLAAERVPGGSRR